MSFLDLCKVDNTNKEIRSILTDETKLDGTLIHLQEQGYELISIIPGGLNMSMNMEMPDTDDSEFNMSSGTIARLSVIYAKEK